MNEVKNLRFPMFLKKLRAEKKLTCREMANLWGISTGYVCELENGNKRINTAIAGELVEKFALDQNQIDELYEICSYDNPRVSRSMKYYSIDRDNLKFPKYIEKFKKEKKLTKKALADALGFVSTYIWDLEKGNRRITLTVTTRFIKGFNLTDTEIQELYDIYNHDNGIIPSDLVYYLVNNKLIDDVLTIQENDKEGKSIKELAESYRKKR